MKKNVDIKKNLAHESLPRVKGSEDAGPNTFLGTSSYIMLLVKTTGLKRYREISNPRSSGQGGQPKPGKVVGEVLSWA